MTAPPMPPPRLPPDTPLESAASARTTWAPPPRKTWGSERRGETSSPSWTPTTSGCPANSSGRRPAPERPGFCLCLTRFQNFWMPEPPRSAAARRRPARPTALGVADRNRPGLPGNVQPGGALSRCPGRQREHAVVSSGSRGGRDHRGPARGAHAQAVSSRQRDPEGTAHELELFLPIVRAWREFRHGGPATSPVRASNPRGAAIMLVAVGSFALMDASLKTLSPHYSAMQDHPAGALRAAPRAGLGRGAGWIRAAAPDPLRSPPVPGRLASRASPPSPTDCAICRCPRPIPSSSWRRC